MITVIPYVTEHLRPETAAFGARIAATLYLMDDTHDYWRLFSRLWDDAAPFIVCEHDIVPTVEQWQSLVDCPQPWCVFAYPYSGRTVATLGFAKFRPAELGNMRLEQWNAGGRTQSQREHDLRHANPPETNIEWNFVDGVVETFLTNRGHAKHVHDGLVQHLRRPGP